MIARPRSYSTARRPRSGACGNSRARSFPSLCTRCNVCIAAARSERQTSTGMTAAAISGNSTARSNVSNCCERERLPHTVSSEKAPGRCDASWLTRHEPLYMVNGHAEQRASDDDRTLRCTRAVVSALRTRAQDHRQLIAAAPPPAIHALLSRCTCCTTCAS